MNDPTCIKCGDEYDRARKELGYNTCLSCGGREADQERNRRKSSVGVTYNKGSYQYIATLEHVKTLGKK
jgi:predicted  nucleic acid-binding Zn-ribbon protein